ncbi:MAG: CRTAC1 family protein [Actinomycetota bacterium]|nr:CRTAC1 family protein [Actinomycetota bacterium]
MSVDFDLNGWPDLLIGRHKRAAVLFRNQDGATFQQDRPAVSAPPGENYYDRHGCAWGEANGDGAPDLYCGSGARRGEGRGPNQLLLQTDGGLRDVSRRWGVQDPAGRARSVHWLDFDRDQDLDIFVSNELRPGYPNVLFRNDGRRFTRTTVGLEQEMATISSSWSDWDNDKDPDIFVLGHGFIGSRAYENVDGRYREVQFPSVTARSWLSATWGDFDMDGWVDVALVSPDRMLVLRNNRGRFRRTLSLPLQAGRVAGWFDLENDGDLDAFVVQGQPGDPPKPQAVNKPDLLLLNQEGSGFDVKRDDVLRGSRKGNGDSVAVADIDRDGRLDLHVTEGFLREKARSRLLLNRSEVGNWLGLRIEGPAGNPFGIGIRVIAKTSTSKLHYFMNDGVAFKSQSEIGYVHMGLASADSADLRVVWPDGSSSCTTADSGHIVTVTYRSGACSANS